MHLTQGVADDPLVTLDAGISWPFGTHTMQLHTATIVHPGYVTLLGELDKFVPISSKRFGQLAATATTLKGSVFGGVGETVHVTALTPRGESWVVVTADVVIGSNGVGQLSLA